MKNLDLQEMTSEEMQLTEGGCWGCVVVGIAAGIALYYALN